jgi:hypothetical protein
MTPKRLRKGGGELQMPLGQCIAHMRPEGRLPVLDDFGVPIVHLAMASCKCQLRLADKNAIFAPRGARGHGTCMKKRDP